MFSEKIGRSVWALEAMKVAGETLQRSWHTLLATSSYLQPCCSERSHVNHFWEFKGEKLIFAEYWFFSFVQSHSSDIRMKVKWTIQRGSYTLYVPYMCSFFVSNILYQFYKFCVFSFQNGRVDRSRTYSSKCQMW